MMAELGGEPRAVFRRQPLTVQRRGRQGLRGTGGARGPMRGFDLVKVTTSVFIVQTLQMVSLDPQIIVVARGAEPESTQVQRTEDGETIIRIFWVGPKGELLRRTPVSSVMQVGFERCFQPCSSLPGHPQPHRPQPGSDSGLAWRVLRTDRTWRPPWLLPGSRAAPGGARAPAAARGAALVRAGGGCALCARPGSNPLPLQFPVVLVDPRATLRHLHPHSDWAPPPHSPLAGSGDPCHRLGLGHRPPCSPRAPRAHAQETWHPTTRDGAP